MAESVAGHISLVVWCIGSKKCAGCRVLPHHFNWTHRFDKLNQPQLDLNFEYLWTQGADATVVACNGSVTLYPIIFLPKAKLIDTNGAGDAVRSRCVLREP